MKYHGIIFDFNGVLWWDGHLQELAWNQFAAQIRGQPFTQAELDAQMHGRTNRHVLAYLSGRVLGEAEYQQLMGQKEALYRRLCLEQGADFKLSPGAVELLDFLAAHQIRRTIATSSEKTNLDFFFEELQLGRWFDLKDIVYDNDKRPGKPAPDVYLQATGNLGLAPADCVVVEDSISGIQAAHAAGIGHIIALGPAPSHHQLIETRAVGRVVENLGQVPKELLFP